MGFKIKSLNRAFNPMMSMNQSLMNPLGQAIGSRMMSQPSMTDGGNYLQASPEEMRAAQVSSGPISLGKGLGQPPEQADPMQAAVRRKRIFLK